MYRNYIYLVFEKERESIGKVDFKALKPLKYTVIKYNGAEKLKSRRKEDFLANKDIREERRERNKE